jgi:general secretion pathway protein G
MAIIGMLSALAIPKYQDIVEKARIARAIGDIEAIQTDLMTSDTLPDDLGVIGRATMLDPWGRPYEYNKFPPNRQVPSGARRDRFLVPINSDFDLYSMGPDGASVSPLTAQASRDDVIRANDGGFVGLAANY